MGKLKVGLTVVVGAGVVVGIASWITLLVGLIVRHNYADLIYYRKFEIGSGLSLLAGVGIVAYLRVKAICSRRG